MPVVPIASLDDPRVAPYRNLKDRDLVHEGRRFIAEGELVVRRLLASSYATESVLCIDRKVQSLLPVVSPGIPVYATSASVVNQIVGFKFHSGVMAVGIRGAGATIETLFENPQPRSAAQSPPCASSCNSTLLICPQIEKSDNLGSLLRIAAGMGAAGMVLGPQCCDPFYRQSVRVSMGAAFTLPILRSHDLLGDLRRLRDDFQVELIATVLADDAQPLETCRRTPRTAILLGNEAQGLPPDIVAACNRKATIPMSRGTDSFNVSVAAAIFLYHFTRVATVEAR